MCDVLFNIMMVKEFFYNSVKIFLLFDLLENLEELWVPPKTFPIPYDAAIAVWNLDSFFIFFIKFWWFYFFNFFLKDILSDQNSVPCDIFAKIDLWSVWRLNSEAGEAVKPNCGRKSHLYQKSTDRTRLLGAPSGGFEFLVSGLFAVPVLSSFRPVVS